MSELVHQLATERKSAGRTDLSRMTLGTDMSDNSALSEDVDIDVVGGDIAVGKDGKYLHHHHDFHLDNDSDDNLSQNAGESASSPGLSSSECPTDQLGMGEKPKEDQSGRTNPGKMPW